MAVGHTMNANLKGFLKKKDVWVQFLYATALLALALSAALASSAARRMGDPKLSILLAAAALVMAVVICITVVPRMARAVDLETLFMPVSFKITRAGAIFILIIFIVAMAALNTGNNLLFLILAVFLSAIVASGLLSRASLKGLSVALQIPDIVYAESAILMRVTLKNHKRLLPSFSLSVEGFRFANRPGWRSRFTRFLSRFGQGSESSTPATSSILSEQVYFPNIPAQKNVAISVISRFPRRGRYFLDGFTVVTRFPFGFFKKGRRFQASGDLVVYPQPTEIGSFFHLLPFADGQRENLFKGIGENLYSHRLYHLGDNVRSVDWKASAKVGELLLKEFTKQDDRKVFIYLDNRISADCSPEWIEKFERAVAMAAGLSSHFIQEGAEVEFAAPKSVVPLQSGQQHLHRILEVLALIEPAWNSDKEVFSWPDVTPQGDSAPDSLDKHYKILLTSRPRGTIPAGVWRTSRVEYFSQL